MGETESCQKKKKYENLLFVVIYLHKAVSVCVFVSVSKTNAMDSISLKTSAFEQVVAILKYRLLGYK